MAKRTNRKHTILWTEDDLDDLQIVREVISGMGPDYTIVEAHNGVQAMNYLKNAQAQNDLPCLIILDMNMPVLCGRKTLHQIKEHEALKNIPVVMFTTSSNPIDRMFCQRYEVDMLTKPSSYTEFKAAIGELLNHCACKAKPLAKERA